MCCGGFCPDCRHNKIRTLYTRICSMNKGKCKTKYIENSYIEFQTELVRFLDMDEAKEIYLNASFYIRSFPSADDDDIDDFFSDSAESAHGQESNNGLI